MADLAKMISDIADIESSIQHLVTEVKQHLQFTHCNELRNSNDTFIGIILNRAVDKLKLLKIKEIEYILK